MFTMGNTLIASTGTGPALTVVMALRFLQVTGDVLFATGEDFSPLAFHKFPPTISGIPRYLDLKYRGLTNHLRSNILFSWHHPKLFHHLLKLNRPKRHLPFTLEYRLRRGKHTSVIFTPVTEGFIILDWDSTPAIHSPGFTSGT